MLTYQSVLRSAPLQVYVTALLFKPTTSAVRTQFIDQIPQWVQTLPLVDEQWDACLNTLQGHDGSVHAVSFSPTGELLASVSSDCTVRLWSTKTGMLHSTLEG